MKQLFLVVFLTVFALIICVYGIWDHDWRMILAGAAVGVIFPLIRKEVLDA